MCRDNVCDTFGERMVFVKEWTPIKLMRVYIGLKEPVPF